MVCCKGAQQLLEQNSNNNLLIDIETVDSDDWLDLGSFFSLIGNVEIIRPSICPVHIAVAVNIQQYHAEGRRFESYRSRIFQDWNSLKS